MTEAQWLAGTDLNAIIQWLRERDWNRLHQALGAYYGWPDHHLHPQVLSAGTYSDGRPYLWVVQADDHDNQWDKPWDQATGLPLLHCVFGNPFRPVTFSPSWRTDTVVSLAAQMYESRDFGAMPILADALQDAGCDSDDILNHCRGDGPHVRGCWVVDLVLGKE
jgi:hypothetical protein